MRQVPHPPKRQQKRPGDDIKGGIDVVYEDTNIMEALLNRTDEWGGVAKLAEETGVAATNISKMRTGAIPINLKIAQALGYRMVVTYRR